MSYVPDVKYLPCFILGDGVSLWTCNGVIWPVLLAAFLWGSLLHLASGRELRIWTPVLTLPQSVLCPWAGLSQLLLLYFDSHWKRRCLSFLGLSCFSKGGRFDTTPDSRTHRCPSLGLICCVSSWTFGLPRATRCHCPLNFMVSHSGGGGVAVVRARWGAVIIWSFGYLGHTWSPSCCPRLNTDGWGPSAPASLIFHLSERFLWELSSSGHSGDWTLICILSTKLSPHPPNPSSKESLTVDYPLPLCDCP